MNRAMIDEISNKIRDVGYNVRKYAGNNTFEIIKDASPKKILFLEIPRFPDFVGHLDVSNENNWELDNYMKRYELNDLMINMKDKYNITITLENDDKEVDEICEAVHSWV